MSIQLTQRPKHLVLHKDTLIMDPVALCVNLFPPGSFGLASFALVAPAGPYERLF
jgi:hypothetical protein